MYLDNKIIMIAEILFFFRQPCFEPRNSIRPTLVDAKPGKEEKRNLISNMEQEDIY